MNKEILINFKASAAEKEAWDAAKKKTGLHISKVCRKALNEWAAQVSEEPAQ